MCLLLLCFTLWRGTPVLQNTRNYLHNDSVTSQKIWSFIHTAMQTSNLASHLALASCYQYYVRINMIIQLSLPVFFYVALWPNGGHCLLILEVSWSHTTYQSVGLPWTSDQHSQQTNNNAPGGIQTHDLSNWVAKDLCLRLKCYWDWVFLPDTAVTFGPMNIHYFLYGNIFSVTYNMTCSCILPCR